MLIRDPRGRPYWDQRHPVAAVCLLALAVNLLLEMLSRRSPLAGLAFVAADPGAFFVGTLIVLLTLSPSLLLPRRAFWNTVVCACWLAFGTANCIVLGFRITPISAVDIRMLWSAMPLIAQYLSTVEMVLLFVAVALILVMFVFVFRHTESRRPPLLRGAVTFGATGLLLALLIPFCLHTGALSSSFSSLGAAYKSYGFSYCFTCSIVDRGVDKPDDYSDEKVETVVDQIEKTPAPAPDPVAEKAHPNVIFIQLESYFDPARIKGLTYAEDPIPNFRALRDSCSNGFLTVPSLGAGTANTEFEVISGMSLDYFGAGEYPYETVLQKTACESICTDLRSEGYSSHAIHNHSGSFYDRNKAFASLGFNTFCSLEYMQNVTQNPIGWATDACLTGEITKALQSTAGRDFIYTITVQAHGQYPREQLEGVTYMQNAGFGDESARWAWGYYLTQLKATDAFIGDLLQTLQNCGEPCVVVMYGDHLPNFPITDADLNSGNTFQTEYLIWSNFGLAQEDKDLSAYQLSADVLGRLGFHDGVLTKLHQNRADDPDYQETLELLEYDLLYGDRAAIGGAELQPTDLQMGTVPVTLESVKQVGDSVFVAGSGFTQYSTVLINGHRHETLLLSGSNLMVSNIEIDDGDAVAVAQVGKDHFILSQTDDYICTEADAK